MREGEGGREGRQAAGFSKFSKNTLKPFHHMYTVCVH